MGGAATLNKNLGLTQSSNFTHLENFVNSRNFNHLNVNTKSQASTANQGFFVGDYHPKLADCKKERYREGKKSKSCYYQPKKSLAKRCQVDRGGNFGPKFSDIGANAKVKR